MSARRGRGRFGLTKRCVEDCDTLDMASFLKWEWLVPGDARGGIISWRHGAATCAEINVTANLLNPDTAWVWLSYSLAGERLDHRIQLDRTFPQYGGVRWWFLCPLATRGIACERRVRKLYRVGGYFGCRHCHDLTYRSRQEHNARVSRLAKDPARMNAMIASASVREVLMGLKAAASVAARERRSTPRWRR